MRTIVAIAALFAAVSAQALPKPEHVSECKSIDKNIQQIEAESRQALPPQRQDQLRATMKKVRDRQFELKC